MVTTSFKIQIHVYKTIFFIFLNGRCHLIISGTNVISYIFLIEITFVNGHTQIHIYHSQNTGLMSLELKLVDKS